MTIAIAVTGTDTEVGKTVTACAIAAEAADRVTVRVFKPVETGIADPHADCDAVRLRDAARSNQAIDEIAPFRFREAVAPIVASRAAGIAIDILRLDRAFEAACSGADLLVVESAGGLLVP